MNLIVSVDKNWAIGKDEKLLFRLKSDRDFFKDKTYNKVVVFGRKTLLSFNKSKALKNRINICLSKDKKIEMDNIQFVEDLKSLFEKLSFYDTDNIFIIGGEEVYKELLPYCKRAFVTKIESVKDGNKFFENLDENPNWKFIKNSDPFYEDWTTFYFCEYENINPLKYNYGYDLPDLI